MYHDDSDLVYAIDINGEWDYVGDSLDTLLDFPRTEQCTHCGGWWIERDGDHYVCAPGEIDGQSYPGCGAVYHPEQQPARNVVF